ncbi:hypothetical protein SDC9_08915 [bioreactor metagenome]|uniref:Uncharacterized protein n=1 Tax=bioreactor metagenome TaxID=1076179 RepID=A0A644T8M6_9ZZZZ|nr:hypothetical protein [Negativicutes bacterium]
MGGKTLDQFHAKQKSKAEKAAKTGTAPTRDTDKTIQNNEE